MLELAHLNPARLVTPDRWAGADSLKKGVVLGLAHTAEELLEIQRLRARVFGEDLGVMFSDNIDQDRFDPWCEHLMVRETSTGQIVGTYRLLSPEKAREVGSYYAETEFNLTALHPLRHRLMEAGRACIHPDYRSGAVLMLLWSGVAEIMQRENYTHLLGCASVSLRDGGSAAAEVWRVVNPDFQETAFRVIPHHCYPLEKFNEIRLPTTIPPLIKGYLKLGAKVCGEPAWDPDFNTVDFPILLDMKKLDERYQRHFGLSE